MPKNVGALTTTVGCVNENIRFLKIIINGNDLSQGDQMFLLC